MIVVSSADRNIEHHSLPHQSLPHWQLKKYGPCDYNIQPRGADIRNERWCCGRRHTSYCGIFSGHNEQINHKRWTSESEKFENSKSAMTAFCIIDYKGVFSRESMHEGSDVARLSGCKSDRPPALFLEWTRLRTPWHQHVMYQEISGTNCKHHIDFKYPYRCLEKIEWPFKSTIKDRLAKVRRIETLGSII